MIGGSPVNFSDPSGLIYGPVDFWNDSRQAAQNAMEFWANESIDSNNSGAWRWFSTGMGSFASLWNCDNADDTLITVATSGIGGEAAFGGKFWRYVGPEVEAGQPLGGPGPQAAVRQRHGQGQGQAPATASAYPRRAGEGALVAAGARAAHSPGHEEWGTGGGREWARGWRWPN